MKKWRIIVFLVVVGFTACTVPNVELSQQESELMGESIVYSPVTERNKHFKDILVLVMMSPSRLDVLTQLLENYRQGFPNIILYGPSNYSIVFRGIKYRVKGMATVYGNLQYVAMADAMKSFTNFTGHLFCNDDMMLHYWSLRRRNKSMAWTSQRGIGYLGSTGMVRSVSGMSYEISHRGVWPFWRQGVRMRLASVLRKTGAASRTSLGNAAVRTPARTKKESAFTSSKYRKDKRYHQWCVFYTVVDAYYVPATFSKLFLEYMEVFRTVGIHQELAVPTVLSMIDEGIYETLSVHYYWAKHKAKDCAHPGWAETIDGFHRCMHDSVFAKWLYHGRYRNATRPVWEG